MTYDQWKGYVEQTADDKPAAPDIPRFTGGQSNIAQTCGQQFVDGMADTLEQHGTDRARRLFNEYADELVVNDANNRRGAYFTSWSRQYGVHFNAGKVAKGDSCHRPYQTAFHEFGHNIDDAMAKRNGESRNWSYKWRDNALGKSIQAEWDDRVVQTMAKSHQAITAEEEKFKRLLSKMGVRDGVDYRAIRRQLTKGEMTADEIMQTHGDEVARAWMESKKNRKAANEATVAAMRDEFHSSGRGLTTFDTGSVSDIVEGCTGIPYPLGVGHGGNRYWGETPTHLPSEFFAEVVDGQAANEASYQLMREVFPNSCDLVDEMIEEAMQ